MTDVELGAITRVGSFDFRWPDATESFEAGWSFEARCRPAPSPDAEAVGRALLAHADTLADQLKSGTVSFTPDAAADALVREDPFAFLLAVISDMGIRAERAWALPYELRQRLGYLSPGDVVANPDTVPAAIQQSPSLHRFVNIVPDWRNLRRMRPRRHPSGNCARAGRHTR